MIDQGREMEMRNRWLCGAAVLVALALAGTAAQADRLPDRPILRLETGMHIARIDRVDSDAAGRLMITGSHDKTARIWDTATGEAVQLLRLPVGAGNEGQVRSVALSHDGRTAAVGGWTLYNEATNSVFFFDVASGRMTGRVDGFSDSILDLEFSPDGRLLAAATGGDADLGIIDVAQRRVLRWLGGYDGDSYNVSWAPDGRLATVSYDGWVRLYDRDLRVIKATRALGAPDAFGLAFSPDGLLLAVGSASANRLFVHDGHTLDFLYEPDNTLVGEGADLAAPAWMPDGTRLVAGTGDADWFGDDWMRYIRIWEDAGQGDYIDYGFAGDNVLDVKVLPDGMIMVVSARPDITLIDVEGTFRWRQEPTNPLYSTIDRSHLRLSSDGLTVGITPFGDEPLTFNSRTRRLLEEEAPFLPPLDRGGRLSFSNITDSLDPRLNGESLEVTAPFERTRSVSVRPDGSFAVMVSDWSMYGFNADGSLRFDLSIPSVGWAVNVASEADLFLVAYGDGTLRWHRSSDGAELLALFVHPDRRRWVAWTPTGYYDAAPGGEDLIGWHLNRGLDTEPSFFPANLFRDRFYRPDIVRLVLGEGDEDAAVARANAEREQQEAAPPIEEVLPPVVRIESPGRGESVLRGPVTLELSVDTAEEAPLTDLQIRVNGRLQTGLRESLPADPDRSGEGRISVTLDLSEVQGDEAIVTVQGVNRHGFGPPVDLMIGVEARAFEVFSAEPRLYVLAIGVSDYEDPALRLNYAAKDAEDMAALLVRQEGALYREVIVRLITDERATIDAIRDGLFWLEEEVTANDTAKIFIAGHGVNDNRGELYFLPHEADMSQLRRTALPAADIVRTVQYLQGRVIYFMDTCHSGNLEFVRRGAVALDLNRHIQDLSAVETGAVVFSSAAGSQFALESPEWGNGAFTLSVLEGMRGAADFNGDGSVSLNELNLFVSDMVKRLTNNQQTPVLQKPSAIRDFPLAMLQ